MKKQILFSLSLLLLIFLPGCAVKIPSIASIMYTESVDYSRFGDFFITESNSVSFEYKPIASVTTTHIKGVEEKTLSIWTGQEISEKEIVPPETTSKSKFKDDVYSTNNVGVVRKGKTSEVAIVTLEGTLDDLVEESRYLGANGIINLKIRIVNGISTGTGYTKGYEISGMAIKK